ncbi:hypothetical protein BDZ89DRAFT_982639 [Hymenopellis radicata]|nr:hypothetical protein BDZ89DRAFT_982639 [Hymenopellis radicata]
MLSSTLASVPQEIVEHVAYLVATDTIVGPPIDLISLVSTSRHFYSGLSITKNLNLYANIFTFKFDTGVATRRLGVDKLTQSVLTEELQRRFILLKRIRARTESSLEQCDPRKPEDRTRLRETLFGAYLLMLENEGKNELHLRAYGIDDWLNEYWFREQGSSLATSALKADRWPDQNEEHALAMWLFWFLFKPGDHKYNQNRTMTHVLKIYALGAHVYQLAAPSWTEFFPSSRPASPEIVNHYSEAYHLSSPSMASPAILSFLSLIDRVEMSTTASDPRPRRNWGEKLSSSSAKWDCEWHRCVNLGRGLLKKTLTSAFTPGSIEGVWEGTFTYTEFGAYAELLGGAAPTILTKSMVVKHRQTWKLREHHLLLDSPTSGNDDEDRAPLSAGDPLRSYFATGTRVTENATGVEVQEPGANPLFYKRATSLQDDNQAVRDIILTGEGHSAWGQFSLVGRIRPCDGFISLSKDYVDGDRGKWLYRGYLIGNADGCLAGRWRDTMSPIDTAGYEGCFTMSRRI